MEWISRDVMKTLLRSKSRQDCFVQAQGMNQSQVARINVFSCKTSQDICTCSESFKRIQVNIPMPVRGLSHLLAVLFGAARLPALFFRQHTRLDQIQWMSKRVQGDNGRGDATRCLKMSRDTEKTSGRQLFEVFVKGTSHDLRVQGISDLDIGPEMGGDSELTAMVLIWDYIFC